MIVAGYPCDTLKVLLKVSDHFHENNPDDLPDGFNFDPDGYGSELQSTTQADILAIVKALQEQRKEQQQ